MKPFEIENLHGIGLMLDRTSVTVHTGEGSYRGKDEIILYVPDASTYETDLTQDDCVLLHFTPKQARALARRLWQLAKQKDVEYVPTTHPYLELAGTPILPPELEKAWK